MNALAALSAEERELAAQAPPPRAAGAMKAVPTEERFSDPHWIFERKLDGIRCIAIRSGDGIELLSRNDLCQNERHPELRELRRADPPFAGASAIRERGVTWVEPQLVAEVGFTEWTGDGRLRHPRFLGLREEKTAAEVVRE
jgi:ATP-dependent DNA ligase